MPSDFQEVIDSILSEGHLSHFGCETCFGAKAGLISTVTSTAQPTLMALERS